MSPTLPITPTPTITLALLPEVRPTTTTTRQPLPITPMIRPRALIWWRRILTRLLFEFEHFRPTMVKSICPALATWMISRTRTITVTRTTGTIPTAGRSDETNDKDPYDKKIMSEILWVIFGRIISQKEIIIILENIVELKRNSINLFINKYLNKLKRQYMDVIRYIKVRFKWRTCIRKMKNWPKEWIKKLKNLRSILNIF